MSPRWRREWLADHFGFPQKNLRKLERVYMKCLVSKKGMRLQHEGSVGSLDEFIRMFVAKAEKAGLHRLKRRKKAA